MFLCPHDQAAAVVGAGDVGRVSGLDVVAIVHVQVVIGEYIAGLVDDDASGNFGAPLICGIRLQHGHYVRGVPTWR